MNLKPLRVCLAFAIALAAAGAIFGATGCGSDGDSESQDASVQRQIEQAKEEGAEAARRQQRLRRLERKVRRLERNGDRGPTTVIESSPAAASDDSENPAPETVVRSFHAPSGNVSCEIYSDGARCSVDSIGETFSFSAGGTAAVESGASLPSNYGSLATYGTVVSAGSVTCTVPQAGEPHGVICTDADSGHGFEASRVPSRQSVY